MDFGKITVRDLKSRNGTLVNGEPVEEAQLKTGDILQIGPVKFVIQVDGTPASFEEYLPKKEKAKQASETEPAAEPPHPPVEENIEQMMEGLPDAELGKSQTELAGDLSEDFDFDEDFNL